MPIDRPLTRRTFIGLAGAAAVVSGCASLPQARRPVARVVVIGGGFGGATVARYLQLWGGGAIEIILVEREARYVSCPLSNLVIGGSRKIDEITLGYERLRTGGVTVVHDIATAIDPERKQVRLAKTASLAYDRLVVSPGMAFMHGDISGYDAEAQKSVLHAWKAGAETVALRQQLEAMPDGGVFLLSIP